MDQLIKKALEEDLGKLGDMTTLALFDDAVLGEGVFVCEEEGILSGIEVASRCFYLYDHSAVFKALKKDGDKVSKNEEIATVKGRIRSLLAVERTALNFLTHLGGIATLTNKFVKEIQNTSCQLKDTRKTTPGLRRLEKMAVKHGRGLNHRQGLYDGILIKDNHITSQSISNVVRTLTAKYPNREVEVEVDTLDQAVEAISAGANILLLDNMDEQTIRRVVQLNKGKAKLEASGGITLENVRKIAKTGVDYISTSTITMAAKPLDISFELKK